jgi:SAM-dependent methyltransferase
MGDPAELASEIRQFMRARVVLTAAELDLFTALDEAPSGAEELASRLGLHARALTRVLDCLITFGLLSKAGGIYRPTGRGALLSGRHPESMLPSALLQNRLWNNWSHLSEAVRVGENPHRNPVTKQGGEPLKHFIGAMHVVGRETSRRVAEAYDASRFRHLLDIGGGSGTYTLAFLEENPGLRATLFDLPDVVPMAEARFRDEGVLDRVMLAAGDFYEDDLPAGCDLALLSAIIHQNDPRRNIDLYRKVRRALVPGGTLLIRDHIMDEQRTHPPQGALFAINMLVSTDGGDTYTFEETKEALTRAGFGSVRLVREGEMMDCLIEAVG